MYNCKNYSTDGGDTLVIGGKLVVEPDAEIEGIGSKLPYIAETDAGTVAQLRDYVNSLVTALKEYGYMTAETWNISTKAVPGGTAQMPTPETIANSAHATVTYADNTITVALDCEVADLEDADHGSTWGVHKWLGFGVDTGLSSIVGMTFNGSELTQADADEASDLGLSAGDFVLYIKAEDPAYLTGKKSFVLDASGHDSIEISIKITETKD